MVVDVRCNNCGSLSPMIGTLCEICEDGLVEPQDKAENDAKIGQLQSERDTAQQAAQNSRIQAMKASKALASANRKTIRYYRGVAAAAVIAALSFGILASVRLSALAKKLDEQSDALAKLNSHGEADDAQPPAPPPGPAVPLAGSKPADPSKSKVQPLPRTGMLDDEMQCELLVWSRYQRQMAVTRNKSSESEEYRYWRKEAGRSVGGFRERSDSDLDTMWAMHLITTNAEPATMAMAFIDAGLSPCASIEAMRKFDAWNEAKLAHHERWVQMLEEDLDNGKRSTDESRNLFADACVGARCQILSGWGYVPDNKRTSAALSSVKSRYSHQKKWMKKHQNPKGG